jgi:hypothetical protein
LLYLITGGLFLCLTPFLWGKVSDPSAAPWCQLVVIVCWLFFHFAMSFDFGCCSLVQEMSFVDHYLSYFRQWLITLPLSALLPFQPLFTERSHGDQLLDPPPLLQCTCSKYAPLLCVFSSLFIVQFFWGGFGGSFCPGSSSGLS